jgi:ankyrin repeat protein
MAGADVNVRDKPTGLHLILAVTKRNVHIGCLLFERGAQVDSGDKRGWTPLHAASQFGQLEASESRVLC